MKKLIIPVITFLCVACSGGGEKTETTQAVPENTVQETASAGETDSVEQTEADAVTSATAVSNHTSFNGVMVLPPQHHATVTLTIGGTVHNTSLLPGMYVKKGAVIATLENPEFINLQQSYLEAHAQTEYLETEYKRQQRLSEQEAASQKRFQESKAEYLSMKSKLEAASAQLTILGLVPGDLLTNGIRPYLEVKSPLNGYITGLNINLGKYVNPGEPLCEVIDKGETLISLTAYEKDLDSLAVGDAVEFRVNGMPSETFHAEIISVGQSVDRVNRSLDVYARVKQSNPQFRPGMYVSAQIR